jgi:plastocyanin
MRRLAGLAAAACVLGAAPALGDEPARDAAAKRVKVGDDYYRPRAIHVRPGSKVTWRWAGRRRHDVHFTGAPRGAKPRFCGSRRRGSCTRRFRKRGRYVYVCTLHGGMSGKVVVR